MGKSTPETGESAVGPPPEFNPEIVRTVTKQARLSRVQLVNSFFTLDDEAAVPQWDGSFDEGELTFGTAGNWEADRDAPEPSLCSYLTFTAGFGDDPTPDSGPFFVGASFRAVYSLEALDEVDDGALESFAYWNGLLTLWPYWRELASSLASRAGVALEVPIFRVPAS